MINIAICIDSPIFSRGIVDFLRELYGDKARLAIYSPGNAMELSKSDADIIILDGLLAQPVLKAIPSSGEPKRVILVSEKSHAGLKLEEHASKICAYFPARAKEARLKQSLETILMCRGSGDGNGDATTCERCPSNQAFLAASLPLSPRELEIFKLVGGLRTSAEIASSLGISNKTLESHYSNIKRKLQLSSSRELLKAATDWVEGR